MIRLYYSETQRAGTCCPEALINGMWVEYTEFIDCRPEYNTSNWDDAELLFEGDEEPEIRRLFCGHCFDCSMMLGE